MGLTTQGVFCDLTKPKNRSKKMSDLINIISNFGTYRILADAVKQGYVKIAKSTARSDLVPDLIDAGLVTTTDATDFMLRFLRFENEELKQKYVKDTYFLKITDDGEKMYQVLDWHYSVIKEERNRANNAVRQERKKFAIALVNVAGLNVDDLDEEEE